MTTTGVLTTANCLAPSSTTIDATTHAPNLTFTAYAADGCRASAVFPTYNNSGGGAQYGTAPADAASCHLPADTAEQFAPVLFWFFDGGGGASQSQASWWEGRVAGVICRPAIQLYDVRVTMDLTNGSWTEVTVLDDYTAPNSVSGAPLYGQAFNGCVLFVGTVLRGAFSSLGKCVLTGSCSVRVRVYGNGDCSVRFGNLTANSRFIAARAVAIGLQIPGAIFRLASGDPTRSLQSFFQGEGGFVDVTDRVYVRTAPCVLGCPCSSLTCPSRRNTSL